MALNIKKAISKKGFTSKQVAEILNVSTVSFSNMINGNPTVETLNKISDVIGWDITELSDYKEKFKLICPHCGGEINVKIE